MNKLALLQVGAAHDAQELTAHLTHNQWDLECIGNWFFCLVWDCQNCLFPSRLKESFLCVLSLKHLLKWGGYLPTGPCRQIEESSQQKDGIFITRVISLLITYTEHSNGNIPCMTVVWRWYLRYRIQNQWLKVKMILCHSIISTRFQSSFWNVTKLVNLSI